MKIYTGYFAQIKKYRDTGLVTISIARFNKYYSGAALINLAPPAAMIHDPEQIYRPKFQHILANTNKEAILKHIKSLANGKDCILLCYEKPGDFCHRHMVSEWLGSECQGEFPLSKKVSQKELF